MLRPEAEKRECRMAGGRLAHAAFPPSSARAAPTSSPCPEGSSAAPRPMAKARRRSRRSSPRAPPPCAGRRAALGGERNALRAPVRGGGFPVDQALADQRLDDRGDIAVRDHHPLRQLAERQPLRRLVELPIRSKRGSVMSKLSRSRPPYAVLDQSRAGEHSEPEAQLALVLGRTQLRRRLAVDRGVRGLRQLLHQTSPPAME